MKKRKMGIHRKPIIWEVDKSGCWNVISHKSYGSYPRIKTWYQSESIHRFIFKELFGEIEFGLCIRHTCDNKLCINPEHLITGTQADNIRDAIKRGRNVKGEKVGTSKLTEKDVLQIKNELNCGSKLKILSEKFNVSIGTIYFIKSGQRWGWL